MGTPALPLQLQHHPCQWEKAMIRIEVGCTHREFNRHHPIADLQLQPGWIGADLPAGRTQTPCLEPLLSLANLEPLELADVVADQIGPRRPAGELQPHARQARLQTKTDAHPVAGGIAQIKVDLNHADLRPPAGRRFREAPGLRSGERVGRRSDG